MLSPEEERKAVSVLQSNSQKFSKEERLKKNKDFEKVFRKGRKKSGRLIALHYIYNKEDIRRLGVTVSKRVDKRAVARNRLKRIFREIFRREKGLFPAGCDIVFRALPGCATVGYGDIRYEILALAESIKPEIMADRSDQDI